MRLECNYRCECECLDMVMDPTCMLLCIVSRKYSCFELVIGNLPCISLSNREYVYAHPLVSFLQVDSDELFFCDGFGGSNPYTLRSLEACL